jgi:pyrroline-5-carboxylate reductase
MERLHRPRLTVIGGGVMGEAFLAGLLRASDGLKADDIAVVEPVAARREMLSRQYGVRTGEAAAELVPEAELVLLAVKPNQLSAAAAGLRDMLGPPQLVLTLMAGVSLAAVAEELHHRSVVRLMPNILCRVGAGMIVWLAAPDVSVEQRGLCRQLFGATGAEFEVTDEKYLDMATAVSGSGPAYMFLVLEALTDAGVHLGFMREQAALLAQQTMLGAALLIQQEGQHPAQLRNAVTSPGGTTVEGLLVLEQHGVRAAVIEAVLAAYTKAQTLR